MGAKRLTDLLRDTALHGAESKDLGGAYFTHAARSFSTIEARTGRTATVFRWAKNQELAGIVLCSAIHCAPRPILFSGSGMDADARVNVSSTPDRAPYFGALERLHPEPRLLTG
jgi:hypothetical protein